MGNEKDNKKELPRYKTTKIVSHYLKPNGYWGKRYSEINELINKK